MNSDSRKVALWAAILALFAVAGAGRAHAESTLFGAGHVGPDGPSFLYRIDPATGVVAPIGAGIGFDRVTGLEFDPGTRTLYGTGERSDGSNTHVLITIDPASGLGTEVGPTGIETFRGGFDEGATMPDISIRPSDGVLFGWHFPSLDRAAGFFGGLSTVDLGTGAATLVGYSTGVLADDGSGLAFAPTGQLFYAGAETPTGSTCTNGWGTPQCDDVLHLVDTATVVATLHTTMTFPPAPAGVHDDRGPRIGGMDFDPESGVLFASVVYGFGGGASKFLGTLDPATGVVALIGPTAPGLDALVFTDIAATGPRDDVVIDFGDVGPTTGLWKRMNDSSWVRLHPASPEALITGDLDRGAVDFDPTSVAPLSATTQSSFRGLQTRITSIDGPAEGGAISATFDNVHVNGVPYEDFASAGIDRDRWSNLEFVRTVEGGQLRSELTRFGSNGNNELNFPDANAVDSFQADVTVTAVQNTFALPRARLTGYFYNDGTAGGGQSGEVQADIGIRHNGSNLEVAILVGRCENSTCSGYTTFFFDNSTFGPVVLGGTYTLSIDFDGTTFTFGFDGATLTVDAGLLPPVALPSQFPARFGRSFKGIGTRVTGISGSTEGASMSARFDNVRVNGAPYDDFASGTIDSAKWADLEFVRRVEGGQLRSELTRLGAAGSNTLNFVNTGGAAAFEADVTVDAISNNGAEANARLAGFFYNDGTPGDGSTGEIFAATGIGDDGGGLAGFYSVVRCTNSDCTTFDILVHEPTAFGPVALGETHRLSLAFDGEKFTFGFDDLGRADVVIDFGQPGGGPTGLWKRMNDAVWVRLIDASQQAMAAGDLDGNGKDDLVIDFGQPASGPTGLWKRMNDSAWIRLISASPEGPMATGDLDGNGQDDVVIDFGQPASGPTGIWKWMNDSLWVKLFNQSAEGLAAGDLDGNGKDDLVIDFGESLGLWRRGIASG